MLKIPDGRVFTASAQGPRKFRPYFYEGCVAHVSMSDFRPCVYEGISARVSMKEFLPMLL